MPVVFLFLIEEQSESYTYRLLRALLLLDFLAVRWIVARINTIIYSNPSSSGKKHLPAQVLSVVKSTRRVGEIHPSDG